VTYYYLIAQLPSLNYNQPAPISSADFRELCRQHLSGSDFALLERCVLGFSAATTDAATGSPFVKEWHRRERSLALSMARERAVRLGRDVSRSAPNAAEAGFEIDSLVKAALAMGNPLEAELFLDKARWDAAEALRKSAYFGVNAVFAYMLKLLLIERRASFMPKEGFAEYRTLYASIMENAPSAGAAGGQ
jgi:hypothetical protein